MEQVQKKAPENRCKTKKNNSESQTETFVNEHTQSWMKYRRKHLPHASGLSARDPRHTSYKKSMTSACRACIIQITGG